MNSSPGSQVSWQYSRTSYVWARQRPSFVTRTFCECITICAHMPGIEARTNGMHTECLRSCFSPFPNPLAHPLPISVSVHYCVSMLVYTCMHETTVITLTPTMLCIHLVQSKCLCIGSGIGQPSTANTLHRWEDFRRLNTFAAEGSPTVFMACSTVWGCVNEPCCAKAP